METQPPPTRLIFDRVRGEHYIFDAETPEQAKQKVQNDQWQEALDDAGVTPIESLVELTRVLMVEPATYNDDRNLAYWTSVDVDPIMVVLVEAIDSAAEPTPELLADVRAGTVMSNVFPFSTLALALAFADRETENGDASCIVLAKRIDEPAYGERASGLLC
jgi:hypothetical protein